MVPSAVKIIGNALLIGEAALVVAYPFRPFGGDLVRLVDVAIGFGPGVFGLGVWLADEVPLLPTLSWTLPVGLTAYLGFRVFPSPLGEAAIVLAAFVAFVMNFTTRIPRLWVSYFAGEGDEE